MLFRSLRGFGDGDGDAAGDDALMHSVRRVGTAVRPRWGGEGEWGERE